MAALSDPDTGLRAEGEADRPPAGSSEEPGNQGDKQDVMDGGSVSFYQRGWGEDSREGSGRETEVGSLGSRWPPVRGRSREASGDPWKGESLVICSLGLSFLT